MKEFLLENSSSVLKWLVFILVGAFLLSTWSVPSEPPVNEIFSLVATLGLVTVILITFLSSWGFSWSSVAELISRFLRCLAFYLIMLWLIGQSGDALYRWAQTNPNDAWVSAVSLIIVLIIGRFCSRLTDHSKNVTTWKGTVATMAMASTSKPIPTERDFRYVAAHEAGHVLVYAALGCLPDGVAVSVNDRADHNGALGSVMGLNSPHLLQEKSLAEWQMLVSLAGQIGEQRLMGNSTLGSVDDLARWLNVAKQYLSNHYQGIFYPEPKNNLELKMNEEKLSSLQAKQLAALAQLFDLNAEVFKALSEVLLVKRTLSREELISFLEKVELPEEFPLPFGEFPSFSSKTL